MTQQYLVVVQGPWSHAYIGKGRSRVEMINEEFSLQMAYFSRYLNTPISLGQSKIEQ